MPVSIKATNTSRSIGCMAHAGESETMTSINASHAALLERRNFLEQLRVAFDAVLNAAVREDENLAMSTSITDRGLNGA